MASINFDCELMVQSLPEKVLTDADHFHVLQTSDAKPIFFCTGTGGALLLIAPDELGQNQVVHLSEKLNVSSPVTALQVTQDPVERSRIYLAAASQPAGNVPSQLLVLKAFNSGPGRWWDTVDWPSLLMTFAENQFQIHRLLMVRLVSVV